MPGFQLRIPGRFVGDPGGDGNTAGNFDRDMGGGRAGFTVWIVPAIWVAAENFMVSLLVKGAGLLPICPEREAA